jgi:glycosyltransferase involved in cell wall biosynthesis
VREVVHIITTIERGGAENQLLTLVREQVAQGLKVTVVPLKGRAELLEDLTSTGAFVDLCLSNKPIGTQVLIIRKLVSSEKLFHAHLPRAELLVALSGSTNFVFSRHNTEPFFPRAPRTLSKVLSRFVTLRANRGIAISQAVRLYLIESGEISRHFRIDVVLYGIPDRAGIDLLRVQQLKRELNFSNSDFIVGTVARLAPQKDLSTLLRAFALIHVKFPSARLIIIGAGPDREILVKQASELGVSEEIIWVGRTSEVYEFLSLMDVFVLTSLYEGFGLVLIEAMVANCPIVAARNSAIPEVLGSEHLGLAETSFAQDFAKKISAVLVGETREKILAQQALRIPLFNPREMSQKIFEIYKEISP